MQTSTENNRVIGSSLNYSFSPALPLFFSLKMQRARGGADLKAPELAIAEGENTRGTSGGESQRRARLIKRVPVTRAHEDNCVIGEDARAENIIP